MGRYYKIILSFIFLLLTIGNTQFAYAEEHSSAINISCLFKQIKNTTFLGIKTNEITREMTKTKQAKQTKEVISLNEEQLNLLSKLVAAEARGESYEGQVAVAAVVLNRVQDSRFPDSIEGVIYQKNAFSVVKNGSIDIQATDESYSAAKEALCGNDPTNNAIYFWNPDISTCKWIDTLNPHLRIGNHVFAK